MQERPPPPDGQRHKALLVVLVALVVLIPAAPGLLSGGRLLPGAGYESPLPSLAVLGRMIAAGELPMWTDLVYGGVPMLTAGGVGKTYPPNMLLFALFPPGIAYTFAILLHTTWAAAGSWRFAARLGASLSARALAAMAFAGCGFVVCHTDTVVRLEAIAWAPWALWAAEGLARGGGPMRQRGATPVPWTQELRGAAALALVVGGSLLTAYYPFSAYLSLWAFTYLGVRAVQLGRVRPVARWGTLAGLGAVAVSAAQTAPSFHAARVSYRMKAPPEGFAVDNSFDPSQLLDMLAPMAFQDADWDVQMIFYAGLLPLGLALLALRALRRPDGRRGPELALLVVVAGSLLLGLGENLPGYEAIASVLLPLEILGRPYRLYVGGAAALAGLAALGWDGPAGRRLLLGLALAGPLLALVGGEGPATVAISLVGAAAVLTFLARLPLLLPLALVGLELAVFGLRVLGITGPSPIEVRPIEEPAMVGYLQERLAPGQRFLSQRDVDNDEPDLLWMQVPMRFDLPAVHSEVSALAPLWFWDTMGKGIDGLPSESVMRLARVRFVLSMRKLDHLRVTDSLGAVAIHELADPAPEVFLASQWQSLPRPQILEQLPTLRGPMQTVLLEEPVALTPARPGPCGQARVRSRSQTELVVEATTEQPCVLVRTDTWDPDWTVRIDDGPPQPVLRAYGFLQAVPLPPGTHQLRFHWRPPWFPWAPLLSLAMVLGLGGVLLRGVLLRGVLPGGAQSRRATQ